MAQRVAEKFIEALAELEESKNAETIAALYAEKSETGNVVISGEKYHSTSGAKEFWTNYRDTFGEVKSEFRNKVYEGDTAALEWTTTGTNKNGQAIEYSGVSILETDGEKITRFFAYFNPTDLGHQITEQ